MAIFVVAIIVYLFILTRRVEILRSDIKLLKQGKSVPQLAPLTPQYAPDTFASRLTENQVSLAPQFTPTPYQVPHESGFDVFAWLQKDFFVKVGALLLLIAFGWFVSYAFANNWVGPMGRITLGILVGSMFMGIGIWRLPQSVHHGGIFTVLGSGVIVLTMYSARLLYDFFTPTAALIVMFLAVACVAFVAVKSKSQATAIAGLLIGALAPVLTNTPDPSATGLFAFLAVLVVGSLWVMWLIRAEALPLIALAVVALYGLPYMELGVREDALIALVWSFAFTAIFFMCSLLSLTTRLEASLRSGQLVLAGGTGLYVTTWIALAAPAVWHACLYAIWMSVFSFGAFAVYQKTHDRIPFYIYSAVSIVLLAAGTATLFDGPVLTIVYTLEVLVLVAVATYLTAGRVVASSLSYLYVGPVLLSLPHIVSPAWEEGRVIQGDFFVVVIILFALALSAVLIVAKPKTDTDEVPVPAILGILAAVYGLVLVWLISHSLLPDDVAVLVSLVLYTLFGIGLYVQGVGNKLPLSKTCGTVLIAMVVARLLLIDVWDMALAGRIITFFAIGALLMSTAFMSKFNQS